ncbi:MAG TPA: GAF domain-containing protein, partial [Leptolyngbya sp.]|nr:GAF domain-containing protein [Leptolyngbya sp.]
MPIDFALDPDLELQHKAATLEQALKELKEENHRTEFRAAIDAALTHPESLQQILTRCTEAVVYYLNAAFARIWILNEATNVLELQASSGLYTHIDGNHCCIPVGKFKIGWIAEVRQPHITNEVQTDPRVSDKAWAKREGMKAFAGYPLVIEDQLVGVLAMFAYEELSDLTLQALQVVAQQLALGIKRKQVEESLQLSEAQLRQRTQQLEQALHELQATQIQIVQSEKRSALGDLVAGVAHEINNPLGFLAGNVQPALEYVTDLFGLLDLYQAKLPDPGQEIAEKMDEIDIDFIRKDLPNLILSMR